MKILLIEDNSVKRDEIRNYLLSKGVRDADILVAESFAEFAAFLSQDIGLFLIDIKLPHCHGGMPSNMGIATLEAIVKAGKQNALLLAISSYPEDFPEFRSAFQERGCILADYRSKKQWQSTLDYHLVQLKRNIKYDFIVFCALPEERDPYIALLTDGRSSTRSGMSFYDTTISGMSGSIILLPKMGLVNAAVAAGMCIERYRPKLIAMSGICGGFQSRARLGQLVVSEMAYEYQSGKWSSDGFKQEPYQVSTEINLLAKLRDLASKEDLLADLELGFKGDRPSEQNSPMIGIFTSGSAVIADKKLLGDIELIHRKVHALDMEIYAVHRAALHSEGSPFVVCAKTVVDLCDQQKDDKLHKYGSYISAKFVIKAIEIHFSQGEMH